MYTAVTKHMVLLKVKDDLIISYDRRIGARSQRSGWGSSHSMPSRDTCKD